MPKIKTVRGVENRKVVSQQEWLVARKKLLLKEKKFSKLRDALNLQRRKLPWVKVEKEGVSAFHRDKNGDICHTYSSYERGIDLMNTHPRSEGPEARDQVRGRLSGKNR